MLMCRMMSEYCARKKEQEEKEFPSESEEEEEEEEVEGDEELETVGQLVITALNTDSDSD